ncbi:aconitate hydratase AcnA [Chloracidobacterium validum]|uniref:Aconitate hydratase n=1 Tax=Chloracidobacterium validum TaxID=2821543 RepID=A0ABX8BCD0_9BACT|nr:aconitate hydratase AcnA [Chloracidobacterium validum]QUW04587.1 aconitate hydratase AcnA [Chloracidobacterium validum]
MDLTALIRPFPLGNGDTGRLASLPALEAAGFGDIATLPVSLRIVLESVLRNCDGRRITEDDVRRLAQWQPVAERTAEIPFVVARVLLQDFTGVPLLCDLAAMRSALERLGRDPALIEPLVPVDLVIDHSVQVDVTGRERSLPTVGGNGAPADPLTLNMQLEFERNRERYEFLKWGMQAFKTFRVIPPGIGICHQVNLEYLAQGVLARDGMYFPDTLVGTDSHTTMINGLGIVGWGVGGIEAEAAMLGQPVSFLTPDVVGVNLTGRLREGVTATDLVLTITEMLRRAGVVGKFVEFHGDGAAALSVPDRATLANMAPEYGATMGFFPVDEKTCEYLLATGRAPEQVATVRNYFEAQGLFGIPAAGACRYSTVLELDLATVEASVAGPKRPQDRIALDRLATTFGETLAKPATAGGFGIQEENTAARQPVSDPYFGDLGHGDVVIAAITSCTNTSNPSVMLAAGLLARKAVAHGLRVRPTVKTSLAPGSRAVTAYLEATGLLRDLRQVGFDVVGYGCTTCIGNSGPLDPAIEETITAHNLVAASVLSGNRNFEARVHPNVKANFLMSPPLVVAFALAGRVTLDLTREPLGHDDAGRPVYLRDVWPTTEDIAAVLASAFERETYRRLYADFTAEHPLWNAIPTVAGQVYQWQPASTYIQEPPFFADFSLSIGTFADIHAGRALAIFGDSVTTDHISPAGSIKPTSPAGQYLQARQVAVADFNSYGARRGNHEVMMRGTFANVRIKNLMVPGTEGGVTAHQPTGEAMAIYDAAMRYAESQTPLFVFAGKEYGTGSSRDWAAKGTALLGVRVVVAESFERIHRSNLAGMGVLPCQFVNGVTARSLALDGTERYGLEGLSGGVAPRQMVTLVIERANGTVERVPVQLRLDTPIEIDYYRHGGILPYVLRQMLAES